MTEHPPELVERVARALAAASRPIYSWERCSAKKRIEFYGMTAAALDAITETHAVVERMDRG